MYPSSSSSSSSSSSMSSQKQMGPTSNSSSGLTRYVSAPGSLLRTAVDSVIGSQPSLVTHHYFTGSSSSSSSFITESTCKVNASNDPNNNKQQQSKTGLQRSNGFNKIHPSSSLFRQRSSPAGFLSHFTSENGFSVTMDTGNYKSQGGSNGGIGLSRLNSQLSFTRQDSLSQISEESENGSFGMDSWENGNSIVFSPPPNKRSKTSDGDIFNCLDALESQFSMPEKLLHIPEDSVPCKVSAKRGYATHPRSIAERERRTRISGKLKKLQELVPNMDKQTSYADMLDLAVQHIKGLQNQVQDLHEELEHCTCGCKPNS